MKSSIYIFLFVLSIHALKADDTLRVKAISKVYNDSIVLRLAPENAMAFDAFRAFGIKIEAADFTQDESKELVFKTVISNLNVQPEAFWKSTFTIKDTLAAIAAQLLFAKPILPSKGDEALDLQQQRDLRNSTYAYSMIAADQSAKVANAMGLRFKDVKLDKDSKRIYRIMLNNAPVGFKSDTTFLLVSPETTPNRVPPVPICESGDKVLQLSWRSQSNAGFTGFHLFRNDGNTTIKLNEAIIVPADQNNTSYQIYLFRDSVINYRKYTYKIYGVDAFGEYSEASTEVIGMARDFTPPAAPQLNIVTDNGKHQLQLKWNFPDETPDLKGFLVHKSEKIDGPYEPISALLPVSARTFTDENSSIYKGSFYKVQSLDTASNGAFSMPMYGFVADSIAPSSPIGLKGTIDTNGVVTLVWNPGNEPDLQGYRVYFANAADHEFSILTGQILADTVFRDTIQKRTLTRDIFYRIIAVDNNYNHSKPCPMVKIKRLDVIPPQQAVFKDVFVKDTTIEIHWINSQSADLASVKLLMQQQNFTDWEVLKTWSVKDTTGIFIAKNLKKKTYYSFKIQSIDSAGLVSTTESPIQLRTYDTGIKKGEHKLEVNYNANEKEILLQWEGNFPKGCSFLLYRKTPNAEGLTKYKVINNNNQFADKTLAGKGTYQYTLKVIYPDGRQSVPNAAKEVLVN